LLLTVSWFYIILDNPRCGRERDYPLYGIDRERGLYYICYTQERGYEMNLRQQLMDTVDRLYVGQSFPLSEVNFLKHNINELLTNNEYLFQECERGTEQMRQTVEQNDKQMEFVNNAHEQVTISLRVARTHNDGLRQTVKNKNEEIERLLNGNMKLSEQLDNRERDVSTEDLREVLNRIRRLGNEVPDVYYKISKVISERESLSPKDMTVEEIQEELGYAIKVVGERA